MSVYMLDCSFRCPLRRRFREVAAGVLQRPPLRLFGLLFDGKSNQGNLETPSPGTLCSRLRRPLAALRSRLPRLRFSRQGDRALPDPRRWRIYRHRPLTRDRGLGQARRANYAPAVANSNKAATPSGRGLSPLPTEARRVRLKTLTESHRSLKDLVVSPTPKFSYPQKTTNHSIGADSCMKRNWA